MSDVFSQIVRIEGPGDLDALSNGRSPGFVVRWYANGMIPFPQMIIWHDGSEHVFSGERVFREAPDTYAVHVPAGELPTGTFRFMVEGCKRADITKARGDEWVKSFGSLTIRASKRIEQISSAIGVKLYFGIHKHMHQPYYRAAERTHWDGENDSIFGSRKGAYSHYLPTAVRQYVEGGLPHAGLSVSFSGSLVEQLNRCAQEGLCGGAFRNWADDLRAIAQQKTALGQRRAEFVAFGFFHPLMPLIPERDIVRQIEWHRQMLSKVFGIEGGSKILFPPETAFATRMIPALKKAGIEVVIYDSIHRYRACRDYPYAGPTEGMLPPNRAEQDNPPVSDWFQLHNIWAGSKISPSILKPEYIEYEAPDGSKSRVIGVPAERYIGNEDARGGYGALQYESVLGQVLDKIVANNSFDPKHPPFFLLHSDGDNHGGGADSYYGHNTGRMVQWLKEDTRFEFTSIGDYLARFPPDPTNSVHIEPGAWSGADNGDPQFMKWFSRYNEPYSPDLNSWAVLTALQNVVHSLADSKPSVGPLAPMERLLLTAETSCYWYWTGQDIWDRQVTEAANAALELGQIELSGLRDITGPTIFVPWITPENPGGKAWGQGRLVDAPNEATLHTFVYDISGVKKVLLVIRSDKGEHRVDMHDLGPYPSRTGARLSAIYYRAKLPTGLGNVRYYIEAEDKRGNKSRSSLERIFLP